MDPLLQYLFGRVISWFWQPCITEFSFYYDTHCWFFLDTFRRSLLPLCYVGVFQYYLLELCEIGIYNLHFLHQCFSIVHSTVMKDIYIYIYTVFELGGPYTCSVLSAF